MKLGAEPKKVALLGILTAAAGYFVYTNVFGGAPGSAPATIPSASGPDAAPATSPEIGRLAPRPEPRLAARAGLQDFRPSLRPKRGAERRDLSAIDPTLRLDLLARLHEVRVEGGARSLFDFSAAPLPKEPEPKIIPKPRVAGPPAPPELQESKPETAASKPPPPPIPLKFYGYSSPARQTAKRAFFLDGDDILVGSEGEVLKKRYRIVRVGVNSVVVEDLEHKHEQTLPLQAVSS